MASALVFIIIIVFSNSLCESDIFHDGSKVTFSTNAKHVSDYFGYTVVLTGSSLLVGAPKATSQTKRSISPGLVFKCQLSNLSRGNITCSPVLWRQDGRDKSSRNSTDSDFFRNDMWFGATMASVPNGKLIVCAPRWADPYKDKHLLANGACYIQTRRIGLALTPLKDQYRLAFKTDGARKEYGEYGTHLNFYAYGQAGMSIKVTENNSILIGAPGLMQWTGGIIDYRFNPDPDSVYFNKQAITNPYFTNDLGPDDYFGYSVESGIFEANGTTLYVAGAPRSKMGYGLVLVFLPASREMDPLDIRAKVRGPQLGSYFGASLSCADINGDGRSDLLVGAPNFVRKDGGLPYDQGAVFVYLADEVVKDKVTSLILKTAGYVSGSRESGARFGSAIADLGDLDGDGYKDVAIGAPWENDGLGAVYIYQGSSKGLKPQYVQRIVAEGSRSLGISISKGLDVDGNKCNDLAIGAHASHTAYLYRCVPTMEVHALIKVPDAMNLPQNATNFTALFCVVASPRKSWPHVKIDLKATITIDPEENRAKISGGSEYTVTAKPGFDVCEDQIVEVKPTADLSKPITMKFDLEVVKLPESTTFDQHAARLSDNSTLHSSFVIQLIRDCGDDLICTPWLVMTLESLNSTYIPGTEDKLGVTLIVFNKEEPAYGAKVHLKLPLPPKRLPVSCSLEGLNMTCDVPAPLERGESIQWDIELEYQLKQTTEEVIAVVAELEDVLYRRNITSDSVKTILITVQPVANLSVSGKAFPNVTIPVTREKYNGGGLVTFTHNFEITNFGPSDWPQLDVSLFVPENVSLSNKINGCDELRDNGSICCTWSMPARTSQIVVVPLRFNLTRFGHLLEESTTFNASTKIVLHVRDDERTAIINTTLVLDPASPIWPVIVGSVAGLLLLALIVYGLYKYGFFSRKRRDELKRLQEQSSESSGSEQPNCSQTPSADADESTLELLSDDSD